jgi:hypothetical protein
MGRRLCLAGAIASVLALSGCGGSSHKAASTSSATAAAPASGEPPPGETHPAGTVLPANAPPRLRAVAGRVLKTGELAGFAPQGARTLGLKPSTWVGEEHLPTTEQASETARLGRLGFVTGVRERLAPTSGGPAEGLSIVVLFGSAQAAGKDLAYETSKGATHGASAFAVPATIPRARGFGGSSGGTTGYNVAFQSGPYYYLVGAGYPTGAPNAPSRAAVILAAQRLYARVHH